MPCVRNSKDVFLYDGVGCCDDVRKGNQHDKGGF